MTLVVAIGGVRSGKSAWAEHQADELSGGTGVTVLATADPADASMHDRIGRHVARRPASWTVVELHGATDLAPALPAHGVALLDGLGGWVAGLLDGAGAFSDDPAEARAGTQRASASAHTALQSLIVAASGPNRALVVASEETGLGVVPLGAGTAAWVDLVGELNQRLVRAADLAVVVVAGRALPLTDAAVPLRRPDAGASLTVVTSKEASATVIPEDGERRAHPRLLGAGATMRTVPPASSDGEARAVQGAGHVRTSPAPVPTDTPSSPSRPARSPDTASPSPIAAPAPGEAADLGALRIHGDRLVRPGDADHAVNVVAEGPPAWLTDAFASAMTHDLTRYPDVPAAEAALAEVFGRPAEEIVATNGAAQALWLIPAALRPQLAACLYPVFTEAEAALHAFGVPVVRIEREPDADFAIDPSAVPAEADLVIVGNPAAASGTLSTRERILALRRPGRTIVVDEAFMDLVPGEAESLVDEREGDVIVVRSFTKSLSIPGVRAGAALASPAMATRLRAVQPPWSVNAFAVAGMIALAGHPRELGRRAVRVAAEREDLVAGLSSLPDLHIWPSATNHVLVRAPHGSAAAEALRAARIAVRPCGSFPGLTDDHLRITARDPAANARLVRALSVILGPSTA